MSEAKCARLGRDKACLDMCAFEGEEKECYRYEPPGRLRVHYVAPERLHHHPDNLRKDVGDVSELAASIRREGIRQPLTVIPYIDEEGNECMAEYTVVIGHRRLEAAKAAGLAEVPCVVTQMDRAEQLATMLTENMQRVDLTPVEQADGFQLMLQLPGATVATVADRTGFSETTVRRRLKLRELDRDALTEADARGGTLADYEQLYQLKDPERRNRVLQAVGTAEFRRCLQVEKETEEQLLHRDRLVERLKEMGAAEITAAEKRKRTDLGYAQGASRHQWNASFNWQKLTPDTEYVFTAEDNAIWLYRVFPKAAPVAAPKQEKTAPGAAVPPEAKKPTKEERIRQLRKEAGEKLDPLKGLLEGQDQAFLDLRQAFLEEFGKFDRLREEIMGFAARALIRVSDIDPEELAGWLGVDYDDDADELDETSLDFLIWKCPEKVLLYTTYLALEDGNRGYVNHRAYNGTLEAYVPQKKEDGTLDLIYRGLESLGYERCQAEVDYKHGATEELLEAQRIALEYTAKIRNAGG